MYRRLSVFCALPGDLCGVRARGPWCRSSRYAGGVSEGPLLKPYQRRIAAGGVTAVSVAAVGLVVFGVVWLLRLFLVTFAHVIWPLVVASIAAVLLRPVVDVFANRLRLGRYGAVISLYVLVVLALGAVGLLLVPVLISQAINIVELTPELMARARDVLAEAYPDIAQKIDPDAGWAGIVSFLPELKNEQDIFEASVPAIEQLRDLAASTFTVAAGVGIVPVYLFFLLIDDTASDIDLERQLSFLKDEWREDAIYLVREFAKAIIVFFRGQISIGLIMGVLLAVGFSLAGLRFGLLFGLALGILNIIPYLGTILGLGTALPVAYLQPEGGTWLVLVVLGVFAVVQIIEGYVLTPRIMGDATGLHPMVIIVAIFFWGTALDGILGMVLAIPLTVFGIVAWHLVRRRYLMPLIHGSKAAMKLDEELAAEAGGAPSEHP